MIAKNLLGTTLARHLLLGLTIALLGVSFWRNVEAQTTQPIGIAELKTGTLSQELPLQNYSLVAREGETLDIEIRRVTGDIIPQFTVLRGTDSLGIWYAYTHGSVLDDLAGGQIRFDANAEYTIQVTSRYPNESSGTYVLLVSATVPPEPLAVGQNAAAEIVSGGTKVFAFQSIPESPLVATVELNGSGAGIVVRLKNIRNDILGSFEPPILHGQFNIAQGQRDYSIEIVNGSVEGALQVVVSLTPLAAASPGVTVGPDGLPIMPNSGACIVATRSASPVNIRPDPSQNNPAFAVMSPTKVYPVTARNQDSTWYQIREDNDRIGWVAALVTRLGGNCEAVPTQ